MCERGVDAVGAGRLLAEGEGFVVGGVHDAFGFERGEEGVLPGCEGGVDAWGAAFGAEIVDVVSGLVWVSVDERGGGKGAMGRGGGGGWYCTRSSRDFILVFVSSER